MFFQVAPSASKYQIKKAVEDLFKVDVLSSTPLNRVLADEISQNRSSHYFTGIQKSHC